MEMKSLFLAVVFISVVLSSGCLLPANVIVNEVEIKPVEFVDYDIDVADSFCVDGDSVVVFVNNGNEDILIRDVIETKDPVTEDAITYGNWYSAPVSVDFYADKVPVDGIKAGSAVWFVSACGPGNICNHLFSIKDQEGYDEAGKLVEGEYLIRTASVEC